MRSVEAKANTLSGDVLNYHCGGTVLAEVNHHTVPALGA